MENIFEFKDYKQFLASAERSRKQFQKGFRSKLAEHIGCQSGYISHVLNGHAQFSLEQTLKIAKFLNLKPLEQKYLLLLVEFARAGDQDLKAYFDLEIKKLLEEHLNIKKHVGDSKILSETEQSIYYSSWHYLAIHVISSLPDFNDSKSIANALKISEDEVNKVLLFLIDSKILVEKKGRIYPGETQIHLNRESSFIRMHHTNWRLAAIQSLNHNINTDLHYSTVSTLSHADVEKLRNEMVKLIEKYVAIIKPSAEETMYGFNIDFYGLIKK